MSSGLYEMTASLKVARAIMAKIKSLNNKYAKI